MREFDRFTGTHDKPEPGLLCRIGLHKWKFRGTTKTSRYCERCRRVEYHNYGPLGWREA